MSNFEALKREAAEAAREYGEANPHWNAREAYDDWLDKTGAARAFLDHANKSHNRAVTLFSTFRDAFYAAVERDE